MGVFWRRSRGCQAGHLAGLLFVTCFYFTRLSTHACAAAAPWHFKGLYSLAHVHSYTAAGAGHPTPMGVASRFVGFGTPRMASLVPFMGTALQEGPGLNNKFSVRERERWTDTPWNILIQVYVMNKARAFPWQLALVNKKGDYLSRWQSCQKAWRWKGPGSWRGASGWHWSFV